jgi:hypothetical protein
MENHERHRTAGLQNTKLDGNYSDETLGEKERKKERKT